MTLPRILFALWLIGKFALFFAAATVGLIIGYVSSLIVALAWLVHSLYKIFTGDLK